MGKTTSANILNKIINSYARVTNHNLWRFTMFEITMIAPMFLGFVCLVVAMTLKDKTFAGFLAAMTVLVFLALNTGIADQVFAFLMSC